MTPYGKQSVWEFVFVRKYICFSSKLSRVFCSLKWATNLIISLYHHSSYPTKSFDCLAKSRLFWISREKFVLLQSTSWLSTHRMVFTGYHLHIFVQECYFENISKEEFFTPVSHHFSSFSQHVGKTSEITM